MSNVLSSERVDRLAILVEEAARATQATPKRFVEPARGTLDRAKSRRNHIVFGRRGSGKTSLLKRALADLSLERKPVAFVDLETFKGHSYPDVLLSVLIATLTSFNFWLGGVAIEPRNKTSFWKRLFGATPSSPPLDKRSVEELVTRIEHLIVTLQSELHAADGASIRERRHNESETNLATSSGASFSLGSTAAGVKVAASDAESQRSELRTYSESQEERRRSKLDFLHRHILEFQGVFEGIAKLAGDNAFVFLDDLYHIRRSDQAQVVDYFHRIAKGKGVWLKVGTIRHRTEWYKHGDPPIGMKLGDDADPIDLDITLEKYQLAKEFLLKVLDQLISEAGAQQRNELLGEDAIDRLVLASGGVARDFLTIFRRSIDVARERKGGVRGDRIAAVDVNAAAGEHDASKREELRRDTLEERDKIESMFDRVREFCLSNESNCLLVQSEAENSSTQVIGELVDLRLLHLVASRVTVRERPGQLFSAYMLDVSQYTGERKRKNLQMIEFWRDEGRESLRKQRLVFSPR